MHKIINVILTLLILISPSVSYAHSTDDSTNTTSKCLSMHVVHNTSAGYIDALGRIEGFHVELLDALQERTGFCIHKKLLPYARAKRNIEMADHDGGILARSADLNDKVIYIAKILTSKTIIIPRKGISLKSYQDLTKITIGRIRGAKLNQTINSDNKLTLVDVLNYKNGLEMLKKGRIDAIAGNSLGLSALNELDVGKYVDLSEKYILGEREVWLLLSNKSQHLAKVEALKKATLALIEEKVVDKILQKYFGNNWNIGNP